MMIKDRLLFLKYALPCAGTLINRGKVSKEYVDELKEMVSVGNLPKDDAEKMFKVAIAMCDSFAERMGKEYVDEEVIRRYFLLEHDKVVDERYELMHDFNPTDCKTHSGKVIAMRGRVAEVETELGKREYDTRFASYVKEGDTVAVHFDFIVEKISEEVAAKMRNK